MPLLNSAIPLFAFAALVISEDCCSVASLNYSMPSLHSVTLCRCCAHIFFTPPLLCYLFFALPLPIIEMLCFALAIITWRSTQCLCSASPSIRYHAVAARGFSQLGFAVAGRCLSQLGFAVASQCNALRALPLLNSSLPLPFFAEHSLPCPCSSQLCYAMPLLLGTVPHSAFAEPNHAVPCLCRAYRGHALPCRCP